MNRRKGWCGPKTNQALGPRARQTHRASTTRAYKSWVAMIQRCTNPNDDRYHAYGGRGIKICKEWLRFEGFLADMGERPEGKSLDRYPDVNGNYELGNCRWASPKEQSCNRRNNHLIKFKGKTETLSRWAELIGIPSGTLRSRIQRGWLLERALAGRGPEDTCNGVSNDPH
jgi:hypothetical protein